VLCVTSAVGCRHGKGAAGGEEPGGRPLSSAEIIRLGLVSKPEWIRADPVDLVSIDRNRDGEIWQCPLDADVLSDGLGVCPKCNRELEKVDLDKASSRLSDQGFEARK
jgi:hypothetical protein